MVEKPRENVLIVSETAEVAGVWLEVLAEKGLRGTVISNLRSAKKKLADRRWDLVAADAELAIMLTDDAGIRTLNKNWRGIDKPTNVLSFPALQSERADDDAPHMLGDIAIAYETTRFEAEAEHKPFDHHLSDLNMSIRLFVNG